MEVVMDLIPLHWYKDLWWEYYNVFIENTDRQERLKEWTEQEFETRVVKILSDTLVGNIGVKQPLHMLGIGSAEGYQEILQTKELLKKFPKVSVDVIEPSREMVEQYRENVQQLNDHTGIEYKWHNQTFQDYIRLHGVKQKYHFISMVHSIHYTGDLEETIRYLYDLLVPGGIILIIVWTEHTGMLATKVKLLDILPNQVATNETSTKSNRIMSAEQIKTILDKNKFAYAHAEYTETTDITACFNEEETTTGHHLLDMITETRHFKASASAAIYNQMMSYIREHTRVKNCNHTRDKLYYYDTIGEIILIKK